MSCAEPVSWLRLERLRLGEVKGEELATVERHLAACSECAAAAASLQGWTGRLPALPEVKVRRRPWTWSLLAVPAAATLALVLWPRPPAPLGLKGADVTLALVRERGGDIALDPGTFAPFDRFKLLVTCPTPHALTWDVVVFQAGQVSYPLSERPPIPCANRTPLPGALQMSGTDPITICVLWGLPPDRARLTREGLAALPPQARCQLLNPQPF